MCQVERGAVVSRSGKDTNFIWNRDAFMLRFNLAGEPRTGSFGNVPLRPSAIAELLFYCVKSCFSEPPRQMNGPMVSEGLVRPTTDLALTKMARLVRSIHMFTGLFLAPWMLMYALRTMVMTHRELVLSFYPTKDPALVT